MTGSETSACSRPLLPTKRKFLLRADSPRQTCKLGSSGCVAIQRHFRRTELSWRQGPHTATRTRKGKARWISWRGHIEAPHRCAAPLADRPIPLKRDRGDHYGSHAGVELRHSACFRTTSRRANRGGGRRRPERWVGRRGGGGAAGDATVSSRFVPDQMIRWL